MWSQHTRTSWPVPTRALAGLVLAATLIFCAMPARAHAAGALARTTDALTGMADASQLSAQDVCPPASATQASCDAQMLVSSAGDAPVHPRLVGTGSGARIMARSMLAHQATPAAAPEPQPGSPAYVQQAYDLTYLSQARGAGDTVAIVDAYDDPAAEADLAVYRAHFGLPPCTTQNGCFRKVDQNGGQAYPAGGQGWASEISLDLDAATALCPRCNLLLVEANTADSTDLVAAQTEAAALGASQISDSWGAPTAFVPTGPYTFPGVATVASAGDNGFLGLVQNQYPAALPDVTAAGGTALIPASTSGIQSPRGFTEQAWSSDGSGCDLLVAKPAWQSDSGCAGRSYTDLSANADPDTGLDVYDSSDGGWVLMGGTSESAPLIAAYYAIAGAAGASPAWAYAHNALLNDPIGQTNGSCQLAIAYICVAGPGYDGPTGVGSISGAVIAGAPGIGGPGTNGSFTQSAGATSAVVQAGIYPNGSDTTYSWQYGTTSGYGQSTAAADVGSGQTAVGVSSTLSGLAPRTTYHYRLAAQNAFGTTYGYDFTLTTAAPSAPTVSPVTAAATGQRTAKLVATINAQGGTASYHFIYGTGRSYRHSTATMPLPAATSAPVIARITGLSPHTSYRVKLVATNAAGSVESPAQVFTTAKGGRRPARRHRPRASAPRH